MNDRYNNKFFEGLVNGLPLSLALWALVITLITILL
jgi:hypothetical protein